MHVMKYLPIAWLGLAAALPALHEVNDNDYLGITNEQPELIKRQRLGDVEAIVGPIGSFMSMATSFSPMLGIDIKGDMTTILCQQFQRGDATAKMIEAFAGSPSGKGPDEKCVKDNSGGSGPYKSKVYEDPTLANHTIYIPNQPLPKGQKLPVIVWSNGFCLPAGTMFENFLREVASFGYMVIANGKMNHNGQLGTTTRHPELIKSIDWIVQNPKPNGVPNEVDITKIVIAGQSCGGVNVYAALKDTRVKFAMMFNSGDFSGQSSNLVKGFKVPVAYFEGGKKDFASGPGLRDYGNLNVPALYADADIGHIGTYYQLHGGKMGKIGVRYLEWKLKGDEKAKAEFCSFTNSPLTSAGWKILSKNGMC